jgi:hypothetical protein
LFAALTVPFGRSLPLSHARIKVAVFRRSRLSPARATLQGDVLVAVVVKDLGNLRCRQHGQPLLNPPLSPSRPLSQIGSGREHQPARASDRFQDQNQPASAAGQVQKVGDGGIASPDLPFARSGLDGLGSLGSRRPLAGRDRIGLGLIGGARFPRIIRGHVRIAPGWSSFVVAMASWSWQDAPRMTTGRSSWQDCSSNEDRVWF